MIIDKKSRNHTKTKAACTSAWYMRRELSLVIVFNIVIQNLLTLSLATKFLGGTSPEKINTPIRRSESQHEQPESCTFRTV